MLMTLASTMAYYGLMYLHTCQKHYEAYNTMVAAPGTPSLVGVSQALGGAGACTMLPPPMGGLGLASKLQPHMHT